MTLHYPDLVSVSDWSCRVGYLIQPIRSTSQIWVVPRHQYGISALVSQTSFGGETSGSVARCRLFSKAKVGQTGKVLGQTDFLFCFNWANLLRQNDSLKYSIYSVIVSDSR